VLVRLSIDVTNNGDRGASFQPDEQSEIAIGNKRIGSWDINNEDLKYWEIIEPTLTRTRQCYFKVPKGLLNGEFSLRVKDFWSWRNEEPIDVPVTFSTPITLEADADSVKR
jgi:hypothetical protein